MPFNSNMESSTADKEYGRKPDEISILNLILTIKEYALLIVSKWYLLLLGGIIFGGLQYYSKAKVKPTYPAKVVLLIRAQDVVNENKQLIKIYSRLINSRGLLESLLLEPIESTQPEQLLVNEYLNVFFEYKPAELPSDIPTGFQFTNKKITEFSREERQVFKLIVEKMATPMSDFSDGFVHISTDDEVGFITINVSSPTEDFSLLLLEKLCQKAENLLFENTIFAPKIAYENLKVEADTIAQNCTNLYYELNRYKSLLKKVREEDSYNVNRITTVENNIHKLQGATEICQAKYLAASKQLKEAQVAMDQKTLLIQQLEKTYAPIEPYEPSITVAAVKGTVMGVSITLFLLILVRISSNILEELNKAQQ